MRLYIPLPEKASKEKSEGERKHHVEVVEIRVERWSGRVVPLKIRPRSILWKPECFVPEPRSKGVERVNQNFAVHICIYVHNAQWLEQALCCVSTVTIMSYSTVTLVPPISTMDVWRGITYWWVHSSVKSQFPNVRQTKRTAAHSSNGEISVLIANGTTWYQQRIFVP